MDLINVLTGLDFYNNNPKIRYTLEIWAEGPVEPDLILGKGNRIILTTRDYATEYLYECGETIEGDYKIIYERL